MSMIKLALIVAFLLYVLSCTSLFRISKYLCLSYSLLSFIPLVNLVYFSYTSDKLIVESHDAEHSYLRYISVGFILVGIIGFVLLQLEPYDVTIISGRIMLLSGCVFTMLTLCAGYIDILMAGYNHPMLVALLSLVIPFPIFLFIASFTIKSYVEESLELYLEQ